MRHLWILMICFALSMGQLAAQGIEDYPDEFYDPVDETPETPTPPQTNNGGQAMLGGQFTPPSTHTQEANGTTPDQGIETRRVFPNTAAEDMGLQPGDIVLSVNGSETNSISSLRDIVNNSAVGDNVSVVVSRDGELLNLNSTFKEWLDGVPKGKIDSQAEQRYRDMQKKRLERRMAQTNDRQAAVNQHLAARKPETEGLTPEQQLLANIAKEVGPLPDFKLPEIDFPQFDFDFSLRVDVDSNTLTAANNDADKTVTVSTTLAQLAVVAPAIAVSYQFEVNGSEL